MKTGKPSISVVIPAFNSGDFIADTLNSVVAQDYDNFDIVVSDDGSADNTIEIVRSFFERHRHIKGRLLENSHGGPGLNRNRAIMAAGGEWISFLDSDDLWFKNKLSMVARAINTEPEVGLWCHSEIMRDGGKETLLAYAERFNPAIDRFLSLYRANSLSTSAVTVKKTALLSAGLFDETLPSAQDYELWLRLSKLIKIGYITEVLGIYVVRDGNISSDPEGRLRCLLKIAAKHRNELRRAAKFPVIEEIKFKGRAYSGAGINLLSQKKRARGLFFIIIGLLYWPFRFNVLRRSLAKNLFLNKAKA